MQRDPVKKVIVRRQVADEQLESLPNSLSSALRRVYAARNVSGAELDIGLRNMLPVSALDGTVEAAERFAIARHNQEKVLVVGDFDADGATATALMLSCMRQWGFRDPEYLVPDRFRFGYGLSAALVDEALKLQPDLIVTVDNGISSVDGVAAAQQHGIDVVVTDHHLPGETLPAAAVIVNPNAPASDFPSKALAGVGVAFYVMAATGQRLAADDFIDADDARSVVAECLDLVALGTVADLVPLDYNNRVLVAQGMSRIRAGLSRPGIAELFAAAERNVADAVPSDLGFSVAPRLNAAGRLEDISVGIECLLAPDRDTAARHAAVLSRLNRERKAVQQDMQADADMHIDEVLESLAGETPSAVCLYDSSWHQGVVGLVATRIKDRLNRPVIAFAAGEVDDVLKGSGRSVKGVHMRDVLADIDASHPGMIDRYGGHAMAAGLSLPAGNLEAFRSAFAEAAARRVDAIEDSTRILSDGELTSAELGLPLAEQLRVAGPWGQAFPEPLFDGVFRLGAQRVVGEHHLKLRLLVPENGAAIDAIAFNQPRLDASEGDECLVAYRLDVNEFRGRRSHQLVVEYIERV